jgi:hypothetical protein
MKTTILEMRREGVAWPRETLRNQPSFKGNLEIIDTRENSYNRILKLAHLKDDNGKVIKTLYNVSILWLADDKIGLTGFERVQKDGDLVDYAQSWVCRIDSQEAGRDNENLKSRQHNFRH